MPVTSATARPSPRLRSKGIELAALLFLALTAVGFYWNSLGNPFVYDDVHAIETNPNMRHLWPPRTALSAPPGAGSSGRPLVALSLAVNYALGGLQPVGYRSFNLGAHILAAWVLFLLLRATLRHPNLHGGLAPNASGLAFAVSLLWVVHPLHTAVIDHVTYRNEILAGLFYLATLDALRRSAAVAQRRRVARAWAAAAVLSCALAMASKEIAVSAPLVALLYDRLFLAGSWREVWSRRRGIYLGLAATWIVLALCIAYGDRGESVGLHVKDVTPRIYAVTQFAVVAHYLRLAFWPHPLVLDYQWPVAERLLEVWPQALLLVVLWGATLVGCWRAPRAAFPAVVFFAVLAPSSSVIPLTGAVAAEHRMYLPLASVLIVTILCVHVLARRAALPPAALRTLAAVLVGAACIALGSATVRRNRDYSSAERIWAETVAERPTNARARGNLGTAYVRQGKFAAAVASYEIMARLDPTNPDAHASLGMALLQLGRGDEALPHLARSLQLDPGNTQVHLAAALLYRDRGDIDRAVVELEAALNLDPGLADARREIILLLLDRGDIARTQQHLRRYLEKLPDDTRALNQLAWLLATAPDPRLRSGEEALRLAERAAQVSRALDPEILDTLAAAQAESGRFEAAVTTATRARELARDGGKDELVRKLSLRLGLYRNGHPYRMTGVVGP